MFCITSCENKEKFIDVEFNHGEHKVFSFIHGKPSLHGDCLYCDTKYPIACGVISFKEVIK